MQTITKENTLHSPISIIGCGWYGLPLGRSLVAQGHQVKGSTTSVDKLALLAEAGIEPCLLNFDCTDANETENFFKSDILIIAIPPGRNTDRLKDYSNKIKRIAELSANHQVKHLILISATSVYGDKNQTVDENIPASPDTESGKQMQKAEQLLQEFNTFTTTIIRFGGLVGPGRHPGRFFAGKKNIPNGKAPVNLIHQTDCIGLTLKIIRDQAFGKIYHAVAPDHMQKQLFYGLATRALHLEAPEFIDELSSWKIISSLQVPNYLHYSYKINNWTNWLQDNPD